jgi:hypothetical protein
MGVDAVIYICWFMHIQKFARRGQIACTLSVGKEPIVSKNLIQDTHDLAVRDTTIKANVFHKTCLLPIRADRRRHFFQK